ncbi:MAG: alpha/beta hydrolase [Acidimicrobiia bacterium]|nr:alpha/beta hydrolase [Acidimicrobiia bacterium]
MATFTTADRTRLHHVDRGSGEPVVVFVHGWCSNLDTWSAQLAHYDARHRVIALDRRGHGRSDPSRTGYEVGVHAADLAELLDHVGVGDAMVVAHAGGVPAALHVAVDHPHLVAGLALIEARLGPPAVGARSGLLALVESLRGDDGPAVLERTYRSFFIDAAGDDAVAAATAMPIEVVADELAGLAIDSQALARAVTQPVWWISAEAADAGRIGSLFTSVQVAQLTATGHFPQVESPEALHGIIDEALAALRR